MGKFDQHPNSENNCFKKLRVNCDSEKIQIITDLRQESRNEENSVDYYKEFGEE